MTICVALGSFQLLIVATRAGYLCAFQDEVSIVVGGGVVSGTVVVVVVGIGVAATAPYFAIVAATGYGTGSASADGLPVAICSC